jgi:hypothetical protein
MKGHASQVSILLISLTLIQLSGILAFAEDEDVSREAAESLAVMAAQDT